ncbi:MAG: chemotaxis protein CheW [Bacteroidales bacterium]
MNNSANQIQVLILERGGLFFAIPLSFVVKVIPAQEISPVNSNNAIIKGIINFKGTVMPVLSIEARFGIEEKELSINDKFVLLEQNGGKTALIASNVSGITELESMNTQKIDALFPGLLSVNIPEKEDKIIYLYNPETIFTSKEIIDIQKIGEH